LSIYLDHAAMTKPLPCALEAYRDAPFGNPSSEHHFGSVARVALENARYTIAKCVNAKANQIFFTSGATEAAAWLSNSLHERGFNVIGSELEHHAVLNNLPAEEPEAGRVTAYFQIYGQNETGEVFADSRSLHEKFPVVAYDMTAATGHIPVDMNRFYPLDYAFCSAHKFGGVPGAGFVVIGSGAHITPMIYGGGQERGMRSGTENVPAICAMAAALEWQTEHMEENTQKIAAMRQMLFQSLSRIPDHKWNTPFEKPCLPHILNISFDGVDAHALTLLLSKEGVMVSPGAACSNGLHEPSHVIMAMYNDEARARSAVRLSLSHENTPDECVEAAQKIAEAVAYLRSVTTQRLPI